MGHSHCRGYWSRLCPALCFILQPMVARPDLISPDEGALPLPQLLNKIISPYRNLLKIAHVNSQSLSCHIDEFRTIFHNTSFDVILICETWLKCNDTDRAVELQGYNLYRNDRLHKGGGGVAAYVKCNLPTYVIHCSDTSRPDRPEFMFLDVCVNGTHVLVSVCYRAPNLGYLAEYEHELLDIMVRYSHVIVMGDFNTDLLGPVTYDHTFLTNMFYSLNLAILPLNATHHTATSATWLDVISVSDPDLVAHHGQVPAPGMSRHDLIFCIYKMRPQKVRANFIKYRNFKLIDHDALINDAACLPWYEIFFLSDINDMVTQFNYLFNTLLERHAPLVVKRITKRPAPWITDHIRRMQKQRDASFRKAKRSKSPADWSAYKKLRNKTQQQIRNSKIRYYYQSLSNNSKSTKSLWSKVKELGIGKSKSDTPININANNINDFFVNVPIDFSGARDFAAGLSMTPIARPEHQFSFSIINEMDVLKAIISTKSNATGADNIPVKLLKATLPITLPVITNIFNFSLISCTFPILWKSAIVRPIPKTTNPQSPSDLRPISILPTLSKCLERIVHNQCSRYIATNNLISMYQSGFRTNHSTTTTLLKITDDIRRAMDKKQLSVLTLFDFSKAFDCVYHPLLLIKLMTFGFSDSCIDWFESYLTGRRQCVQTRDGVSDWRPISRGVPQGSVLGPLLFSLYINDITRQIRHSKYHLYADDLQIYQHFHATEAGLTISLMNDDIDAINLWTQRHGLKLNADKTQAIVIAHPRQLTHVDINVFPRLTLNASPLDYSDKVKNLGLIINKSLTWTDQITMTCNGVFAGIHSLKRYASCLPFSVKVMLVKTLVLPHFNYCDVVVNDMTVKLSDKLQLAQNYCIRFIFNLRRQDHVTPFYVQLSLMKLKVLREYHIILLLHKVLYTKSPSYLSDRFKFMSEISSVNTRQGASILSVPIHRTTLYNKSFTVTACRLWNMLPDHIRNIDGCARFGAEVRRLLLRDR